MYCWGLAPVYFEIYYYFNYIHALGSWLTVIFGMAENVLITFFTCHIWPAISGTSPTWHFAGEDRSHSEVKDTDFNFMETS